MGKDTTRQFKVIIVGAGISGLLLANLLVRADIEFVVLEAHEDIFCPSGGSFGIWPNAARILDQIDCWKHVEGACAPLLANHVRKSDGTSFIKSDFAARIAHKFGYDFRVLERHTLVRILYENLPDRSKVLMGQRVTDVLDHENGVRVLFDTGACEGDIVVGCDGVHSVVREIMWKHANTSFPRSISAIEKRSLTSSYRCLVGAAPFIPEIAANESNMIQGQGSYMVVVAQPHQTMFFVCVKEERVSSWPKRTRFTEEDAENEATKMADIPVTEHLLFGELWIQRTRGYLCSMEEGIFEHWSFGRIVLVGDSAHKLSPVGAHGGNCAIESVAAFSNTLVQHLDLAPSSKPSSATILSLFDQYQRVREGRVRMVYRSAHFMTRVGTWDTFTKKIIALWLLPWRDDVATISALIFGAVKVDFIPVPGRSKGFRQELTKDKVCDKVDQKRGPWDAVLMVWAVLRAVAYLLVIALQRISLSLGVKQ